MPDVEDDSTDKCSKNERTMAPPISTKFLTTFLSLNALQCDQLAGLIMGSITYEQGSADECDSTAEAIKLCEQTLDILHTFQLQTKNKNLCKTNAKMKLSITPNGLSKLPRDNLFSMCDYLDSFSKAHLRFTSMTTHIDMMGCPLVLDLNIINSRCLLDFTKSYAPLRIIKCQPHINVCGCDASRQLQLIDFRTAEVNQTLCSDLTESQLSLLGIGRSWSITKIEVNRNDTTADFLDMCDILKKHNAYRSLKRLKFDVSDENKDVIDALSTCGITEYVEDFYLINIHDDLDLLVTLSAVLPSFKRIRCVHIQNMSTDGSLNDFVKYSPQIEELILIDTVITGDIRCLAQLKNSLRKLEISYSEEEYENEVCGDVSALSSCTKLTYLCIDSGNVTGNISSLNTLTNLEVLYFESTNVNGKIESLLKFLPKLFYLSLWDNSNLTGDLSSLTHLKKLKECYIGNIPHLKGDISVMSGLTKLKSFELKSLPNVTGSVNSLVTLTNLESLELKLLPIVTGSINSLAILQNLSNLELKLLPNVTGNAFLFTLITSARFYDCDNIVTRK